jgi:hypothetical protein
MFTGENKRTRNPILAEDKTPDVALDKYNIGLISAKIPYVAPQMPNFSTTLYWPILQYPILEQTLC